MITIGAESNGKYVPAIPTDVLASALSNTAVNGSANIDY